MEQPGLEEVGGVFFEGGLDLFHGRIHESDGANHDRRYGFVAVSDRSHDRSVVRVRPDVAFIDGDAG